MANVAEIIIRIRDEGSGSLRAIGREMDNVERKGNSLGGVLKTAFSFGLGAGVANTAVGLVSKGVGGLKDALFGLNTESENVRAQFMAFTKSATETDAILAQVRKEADATPFTFSELSRSVASLIPSAKQAQIPLMDLTKTAEILAASHPEQGLEGAAFALREALSGDFVSIADRFDLPRQYINQLKAEGVPNIEIVRRAMLQMGYDADLVGNLAQTTSGRFSTFRDTLDGLKRRLTEPLFKTLSDGLAQTQKWFDANKPSIDHFADVVGNVLTKAFVLARDSLITFGQALTGHWTDAPGIVGLHRVIGNIGLVVRNDVIPAIISFAGFVKNDVLPALLRIGQWVGTNIFPLIHTGFVLARDAVKTFVEALSGNWQDNNGIVGLHSLIGRFGLFLRNEAIPAVTEFIEWIGPKIVAGAQTAWQWITGTAIPALQNIAGFISDNVIPAIATFVGWLRDNVPPAVAAMADAFNTKIMPAVRAVVAYFTTELWPRIREVVTNIGDLFGTLVQWTQQHWDAIRTTIEPIVRLIATGLESQWNLISGTVQAVWTAIKGIINGVLDEISGVIKFWTGIFSGDWGKAWDGIKEAYGGLWEAMKGVVSGALGIIKTVLSTAWTDIQNVAEPAWNVFKGMIEGVWTGIKETAHLLWEIGPGNIVTIITGAYDTIHSKWDSGKEAVWNAIKWPFEQARDHLGDIMDGIKTAIAVPWNLAAGGINAWISGFVGAVNAVANKIVGHGLVENAPQIPTFARGGVMGRTGLALVGEQGPELAILPGGTRVVDASQTAAMLGRGGIWDAAADAIGAITDTVRGLIGRGAEAVMNEAFKVLPGFDNVTGIVKDLATGMASGLKDAAISAMKDLFAAVKHHFPQPAPGTSGGGVTTSYDYTGNDAVVRAALAMLNPDGATWNGWCERFVGNVADRVGAGRPRMASALVHANAIALNPGWGPVGSVQYWKFAPDGHVDVNGPNPGEGVSTGSWGIGVVQQSRFGTPAGWAPIQLATGGITQDEGVYHLHPREAVIPLDSPRGRDLAGGGGDIIFQPGAIVVQGTVVTERDLVDAVHTGLLRKKNEGQRLNLS